MYFIQKRTYLTAEQRTEMGKLNPALFDFKTERLSYIAETVFEGAEFDDHNELFDRYDDGTGFISRENLMGLSKNIGIILTTRDTDSFPFHCYELDLGDEHTISCLTTLKSFLDEALKDEKLYALYLIY